MNWLEQAEIVPGGTMATVYHRTGSMESIEKIFEKGFQPGAGAMYGKGLYTCYDINSQFSDYMDDYGDYLVKFAVNTATMVNYDKIAQYTEEVKRNLFEALMLKIFGKKVGYGTIIDELIASCPKDNGTTSEAALRMVQFSGKNPSMFINAGINGLIFTGSHDGKVAVIYDSKIAIPISYAKAPVDTYADNISAIQWDRLDNKGRITNKYTPVKPDTSRYFAQAYKKFITPMISTDNNYNMYTFSIDALKEAPGLMGDLKQYITSSTNNTNAQLIIGHKKNSTTVYWYYFNLKYATLLKGKFENNVFKQGNGQSRDLLNDIPSLLPGVSLYSLFSISFTGSPKKGELEKVLHYYKAMYVRLVMRYLKDVDSNLEDYVKRSKSQYIEGLGIDDIKLTTSIVGDYLESEFEEVYKAPLVKAFINTIYKVYYVVSNSSSKYKYVAVYSDVLMPVYNEIIEKVKTIIGTNIMPLVQKLIDSGAMKILDTTSISRYVLLNSAGIKALIKENWLSAKAVYSEHRTTFSSSATMLVLFTDGYDSDSWVSEKWFLFDFEALVFTYKNSTYRPPTSKDYSLLSNLTSPIANISFSFFIFTYSTFNHKGTPDGYPMSLFQKDMRSALTYFLADYKTYLRALRSIIPNKYPGMDADYKASLELVVDTADSYYRSTEVKTYKLAHFFLKIAMMASYYDSSITMVNDFMALMPETKADIAKLIQIYRYLQVSV